MQPAWTRIAVPLVAVSVLCALATTRQERPTRPGPLFMLTSVLGLWMFGVGLVWSKRFPSMLRWPFGWASHDGSWEWTALFVIAWATLLCVALALRSFSASRPRAGWGRAGVALALFAGWSLVVRYSGVLAVLAPCVAGGALWAAANPRATNANRLPVRGLVLAAVIAAVTSLSWFWLIVAFIWWVARGEGGDCRCWADNYDAWQFNLQFVLALVGTGALAAAAAGYLRRGRAALIAGGAVAVVALGAWLALLESAQPPGHPLAFADALPAIRQALVVHPADAA
jgi:hypothetical protein